MGQLDASIVTIALPAIRDDLGGSLGAVEWVSLAYLLTLVIAVVPLGRAADSLGRKSLYLTGFAVFGIASLACALAPDLLALGGARVVQGIGAALLQANSIALIATSVPRRSLGRAIGVQGGAQAVGLALGPSVGGLLLGIGDWRLLFAINIPVAVLGIAAGTILLPRSRRLRARQSADVPGLVMMSAAIALVLLGLSWAARETHLLVPGLCVAVGVLAAVMFYKYEKRVADPSIDPALLTGDAGTRGLGGGVLAAAAAATVLFGVLFVVPFFLRAATGASATRAGLSLTVLPVVLGIAAPLAGVAGEKVGKAAVVRAGSTLCVLGLLGLAASSYRPALVIVALAVIGAGLGLVAPANSALVMSNAPAGRTGAVAGMVNMARGLGTAVGVAIAAVLYARIGDPSEGTAVVALALIVPAACLVGGARLDSTASSGSAPCQGK